MRVWAASWDVDGTETGFEIFISMDLAVEAAIGYAQERSLVKLQGSSVESARASLRSAGELSFEDRRCYYAIEEHEVIDSAP